MANWFTSPASDTMLQNTFGNTFFKNQVAPVQNQSTAVRPTNWQALKNWRPWKAFMPRSMGGTFYTQPTAAASKFMGSNIASGLPFAYAYGAGKLQESLPQSLQGQGGIYDRTGYDDPMSAGASFIDDEVLRYGDQIVPPTNIQYPGGNPYYGHDHLTQDLKKCNLTKQFKLLMKEQDGLITLQVLLW